MAPHPMVAKVAHPQTTPQAKQVKEQEMVKEHRQVDKVMAILKTVKVKEIVAMVKGTDKVTEMAAILILKAMAGLMAQVKVKVTAMVAVKKETATIVAVKVAKMLNVHSPKMGTELKTKMEKKVTLSLIHI